MKLIYKEYVGEPMLSPIITDGKMKTYYAFLIIDLRFQVDHISPKKIRPFKKMRKIQLTPFCIQS